MKRTVLPILFPALFLCSCQGGAPRIDSIFPRIGRMGDVVAIRGSGFGGGRDESWVTIAGISPTSSSYLTWSDSLVTFRVPEFGESGLVYVYRNGRKSNAALFSNILAIPVPRSGETDGSGPRILAVNPPSAATGSAITIVGENFGSARESRGVYFAWGAGNVPGLEEPAPAWIAVREGDPEFESWTDREIRVRVPDGAVSGPLEVRSSRGSARPGYFSLAGRPGTRTWREKRSYALSWSVNVKVEAATAPNTLYIWLPGPAASPFQQVVEILERSGEPFIENYRGLSLYKYDDLAPGAEIRLAVSCLVDVYGIETVLRPQDVREPPGSFPESVWQRSDPLVPSDDRRILELARNLCGRERNPWLKAKLLYGWMIREMGFSADQRSGGALPALAERKADSWQGALLYCALLRASGVPALPVSGVLVTRNRGTVRHFWTEFWINGFGWIPVDVALGAGAAPENFSLAEDCGAFYFGNLDNRRIAFSRGRAALSRMDSRGRTVPAERDWSLQPIREEAVGGLTSYSSLWSDVELVGVYAN